jgi:hypothetical protein
MRAEARPKSALREALQLDQALRAARPQCFADVIVRWLVSRANVPRGLQILSTCALKMVATTPNKGGKKRAILARMGVANAEPSEEDFLCLLATLCGIVSWQLTAEVK